MGDGLLSCPRDLDAIIGQALAGRGHVVVARSGGKCRLCGGIACWEVGAIMGMYVPVKIE